MCRAQAVRPAGGPSAGEAPAADASAADASKAGDSLTAASQPVCVNDALRETAGTLVWRQPGQ
jgi:hypothetical protein